MIKKWDIKDEQARRKCVDEVLARIDEQDGGQFGVLAAEDIIEIVGNYVGPQAYNSGIEDSKKVLQAKLGDIEVELDILKMAL